jgi:hypothetical protein
MSAIEHQPSQPLRGRSIFLALETGPENSESRIEAEALQETVVSLARAVFSRGGTLLMAESDPLLSLILIIATEYWQRSVESVKAESPRDPFVRLCAPGEDEDLQWWSDIGLLRLEGRDWPMQEAILVMIENEQPLAMICLGGVGRVARQAVLFREHSRGRPIFTIAATGGDSRELAGELAIAEDRNLMERLEGVRAEARFPEQREPFGPEQLREEAAIIPFPLVMQRLVDRLASEH